MRVLLLATSSTTCAAAADAGVCFVMTLSLPSHYFYLLCYSVLSVEGEGEG